MWGFLLFPLVGYPRVEGHSVDAKRRLEIWQILLRQVACVLIVVSSLLMMALKALQPDNRWSVFWTGLGLLGGIALLLTEMGLGQIQRLHERSGSE